MSNENIVTISSDNFSEITSTPGKLILIDFWAKWCLPCRAVAPVLDKLAGEYPENLIVGKLNVDDERDLAVAHDITSIPTIQFYKNGEKVDTLVGSLPYQDFKSAIDKNL